VYRSIACCGQLLRASEEPAVDCTPDCEVPAVFRESRLSDSGAKERGNQESAIHPSLSIVPSRHPCSRVETKVERRWNKDHSRRPACPPKLCSPATPCPVRVGGSEDRRRRARACDGKRSTRRREFRAWSDPRGRPWILPRLLPSTAAWALRSLAVSPSQIWMLSRRRRKRMRVRRGTRGKCSRGRGAESG
jgi:hypothetical protein